MSEVCICCSSTDITAPPLPVIYGPLHIPTGIIKKTKHWCNKCNDYTELITIDEFQIGYNLHKLTKRLLLKALNKGKNKKEAAVILGLSDRTLYRKIKEYDIKLDFLLNN
jgi:transcriptional regulator with PAS, ATPase and Fis domain